MSTGPRRITAEGDAEESVVTELPWDARSSTARDPSPSATVASGSAAGRRARCTGLAPCARHVRHRLTSPRYGQQAHRGASIGRNIRPTDIPCLADCVRATAKEEPWRHR